MLYGLNFSRPILDLLSFFAAENPSRTACRMSQTVEMCAIKKKLVKKFQKFSIILTTQKHKDLATQGQRLEKSG